MAGTISLSNHTIYMDKILLLVVKIQLLLDAYGQECMLIIL